MAPDDGNLLVVDDELFLREAVAASLRFLGFEVTAAETGLEALHLARNRPFDLLILDVLLPDIDGFEIVRRLRRDGNRVPVIFLTAALNGMLARIEAAVAEREASQQQMRRFFADASHELRTPIASLRANAELYQQGALSSPDELDEVMNRIVLETRRMGRLVDDMLRLAGSASIQASPASRST